MLFENSPIDLEQLPQIETVPFESLAPAYPKVSHIGNTIFFSILAIILILVFIFTEIREQPVLPWALPSAWLFWLAFATWLVNKTYQIQGYAIREKDIIYRSGVFFRRTTVIPFNRVQHCEVKQGPIERLFNMRTLEVYTAGGQSSDLSIPGLSGDLAEQLKEFIIKRTAAHDPE